jgi:WD40 repeat protein
MSTDLNYRHVGQFDGHTRAVQALAVLPNGKLASGSWDFTICIWDIATQRCEATLRGHENWVYSLGALRSGKLASGSADKTIRIWNVSSQQCEIVLQGHEDFVSGLVQLPNNNKLASGSRDKTIRIWDLVSQECETVLSGHEQYVNTVAVLPHDKLASGSDDKTIRIWDMNTKQCATVLRGHESHVTSICTLSNNRVTSGSTDSTVRVWNLLSENCELVLRGHEGWVNTVMGLPNNRLASGSDDSTVRVWNLTTGLCEGVIKGPMALVTCLTAVSMDTVACGGFDLSVRLFQYECCDDKVELSEVLSSPLLSAYSLRASVVAGGRSYTKWAVNLWYNVDGTAHWVHQLREHYKARSRLSHVLRVNSVAKGVDLGQYFVNLALVRHVEHLTRERGLLRDKEGAVLSLDRGELYDRLFTENRYCAVEDIFGCLLDRSQPAGWIRIVGRAGTGKTTLTHYLAYRWGQKDSFWDNRFDVVFRVKLNLLAQESFIVPSPDMVAYMAALIHGSFEKSTLLDVETIAYFLRKRPMVTLLLLDGFDEIASSYDNNPNVKCVMDYALSLPNGVLTSRPVKFPSDWAINECFKHTFENIGLSEENVRSYVDQYFARASTAAGQSRCEMLDRNPTMMKLAQIPVNLNAMCGIWKENGGSNHEAGLLTVTGLYDRMVLSVLRHHRMGQLSKASEKELTDEGLRNTNYKALRRLSRLAFAAFELGQTQTLGANIIDNVVGDQENLLALFRDDWGLLRQAEVVDSSKEHTMAPHYFVHLTYQEYFVALYFAEALVPTDSTPIGTKISQGKRLQQLQDIQALAIKIRDNRDNPRYAVIWTFLAGLLSRTAYTEHAAYYWDALLPEQKACFQDTERNNNSSTACIDNRDRNGSLGVHANSAVLSVCGGLIREALFGCRECETNIPTRLSSVKERILSVLQWQLLCENANLVALGDVLTNSKQELSAKRRQHRGRQRQLRHDLVQLGGQELSGCPLDILHKRDCYPEELMEKYIWGNPTRDLDSREVWIRKTAMRDLCQQDCVEAVPRLQQLYQSDAEASVRARALVPYCLQAGAADETLQTRVVQQIKASLNDSEPEVRRNAVMLLGVQALHLSVEEQTKSLETLRALLSTETESVQVRLISAKLLIVIDNDQEGYKYLISVLRNEDAGIRLESLSCLKERASLFDESVVKQVLMVAAGNDQSTTDEQGDIGEILRRIRPEKYEKMALELLSVPLIARGFTESLWLHMGSSDRSTPLLQRVENELLDALSCNADVAQVIRTLREPLSLPLVTNIFEESFAIDTLNKISANVVCQGVGTSVASLNRCCDVVGSDVTLHRALFGPGHCLTSDMYIEGITLADVENAVTRCNSDLEGAAASLGPLVSMNRDSLVAIRLYTLEAPAIFKLLNYPFYNINNRDPNSLRNQLPFMKYLLLSYDAVFSSDAERVYTGPGFRGMNTSHSDWVANKYSKWEHEFAVGKKVTFPSFTSVSLDMSKAEDFASRCNKGCVGQRIIYIFSRLVGLRLGVLSSVVVEQEVLVKPPAVFIIRDVAMRNDGTLHVSLEVDVDSTLTYL